MALGVGYIVAAARARGSLGAAHDASGGWTVPLVVLMAMTAAELAARASRRRATVR